MVQNNADMDRWDRYSSALTAYQAATKLTMTGLRSVFQDTPGMLLNMADVGQLHNIGTVLHSAFRPKEAAQFGIGAEVAVRAAREGQNGLWRRAGLICLTRLAATHRRQ